MRTHPDTPSSQAIGRPRPIVVPYLLNSLANHHRFWKFRARVVDALGRSARSAALSSAYKHRRDHSRGNVL
jgi:hypothetical protein